MRRAASAALVVALLAATAALAAAADPARASTGGAAGAIAELRNGAAQPGISGSSSGGGERARPRPASTGSSSGSSSGTTAHERAAGAGAVAPPQAQQQQPRPRPAAAAKPPRHTPSLPAREAAAAAAAAALSRAAPLVYSASPAPHYANYSLASSRDTFEICKNQSGLSREISMEELLPIYGLPADLIAHRRVPLSALASALASAAPTARLVIAPLLAGEAELSPVLHPDGRLPRLLHFTVRDKDGMLPHQALSIATWARLNPGYSILLYDDDDIAAFMAAYHPRLLPLFHRLGSQVERTDLWRYLVLCTFGGVYADSDVVAGRPVDSWAQDAGLLTGVENVFETMAAARRRDYTRVMQIVQWTIAARPGHPVVCRMGDYIGRRVDAEAAGTVAEEDRDHAILERTGPGIWSSSVHDYLRAHGVAPESAVGGAKVGDVRLLPQSVFGCASSTVNLSDPMAYVYHQFKGSWRLHEPRKLLQFVSHLYAHLFAAGARPQAASPAPPAGAAAAAAGAQKGAAGAARKELGRRPAPAGGGAAADADAAAAPEGAAAARAGAVERRLQEQAPATAAVLQLQPLARPAPAAPRRAAGPPLLPVAAGLVAAALVCGAAAQRAGGKGCGGTGSGSRPCGGLRQSAGGALSGIWGGARRLASGARGGALSASASAAALLPLSQLPAKGSADRPPSAGGGSGGGVAAASSATRQQGSSGGGCLKRSSGSVQCLQSMQ
jgi:hypothetical protein